MPQASGMAFCRPLARLLGEGQGDGGRGDEAAGQAGQRLAALRPEQPGQHIADQRQARDEDDEQPELVGIERAPGVDRLVWKQRQRDEGGDQQPQAGEDVVPAELVDEAVQRLLVGEHRGGDDGKADGERLVAEHDGGAEQEDDDAGHLGGEPLVVLARARRGEVAGGDEGADGEQRRGEDPGRGELFRHPAGGGAEQRQQDEGAQAGDVAGVVLLRLPLLALDADQRAEQDGGGEVAGEDEKVVIVHGCLPWRRSGRLRAAGSARKSQSVDQPTAPRF